MPPRPRAQSHSSSEDSSSDSNSSSVDGAPGFIAPTSFDAYFLAHSKPSKTSKSSFSGLVPPLPTDYKKPARKLSIYSEPPVPYTRLWDRWILTLDAGFDICLYGYGSKHDLLSGLANYLKRQGNVILVKGYANERVQELLDVLEQAYELGSEEGRTEARVKRVIQRVKTPSSAKVMYLLIEGLHALPPVSRNLLFALVDAPRTRFVICADHINSPLFVSEIKPEKTWIWHDATTLVPYVAELAKCGFKSSSAAIAATSFTGPLTKSAASHVLASVTLKAKRLFHIIAIHQIQDPVGMSRALMSKLAAEKLFITAGTALTALLSEFIDHNLLVIRSDATTDATTALIDAGGDAERVVINLRPDVLLNIELSLRAELAE